MAETKKISGKTVIFYVGVAMALLICFLRCWKIYINDRQIDFTSFVACAHAVWRGLDFYNVANIAPHYEWTDTLIVFPGMLLFYIPFSFMNIDLARNLHFAAMLAGTGFIYYWIYRMTGLLRRVNFRNVNLDTVIFFGGFFVFFNSSPTLMCLRHGQQTVWITLALLLLFTFSGKCARTVTFGLSALMKYSMITLFGPLLFLKKQYVVCVAAFVLFGVLCLYPALLGYNVIALYKQYVAIIKDVVSNGFCTFEVSGYNMLQCEFFHNSWLNALLKIPFAATIFYIFWREQKKSGIGLNLLLLTLCFTMLVSYHRLYDNVPIILLLLIKTHFLINRKDWINASICGSFLGWFLIPLSWIFRASNTIGGMLPGIGKVVYLCRFAEFENLLPFLAWMQIVLSLYVLYLYLKTTDDYIFKLIGEKESKK